MLGLSYPRPTVGLLQEYKGHTCKVSMPYLEFAIFINADMQSFLNVIQNGLLPYQY
ncbi:hypothetical protein SLEP1_g12931 [Rubroshorea leprosula]|uniref:Uncharacterized protein n=1 Tax=Rubroshorea leprosula TaxID=152421 RepID=A0AAV5IM37_9ROSI|nr:hypothetical protein SLEP1_g12931 [Rubroshorea leprosula]